MAHSKNRATDGKITYPPGVKEISDKISKEEMVRRLKVGNATLFRQVERKLEIFKIVHLKTSAAFSGRRKPSFFPLYSKLFLQFRESVLSLCGFVTCIYFLMRLPIEGVFPIKGVLLHTVRWMCGCSLLCF